MEYNDNGFVAGSPIASKDWRGICPDESHGLTIAQGTIPPGVLMLQNYMSEAACKQLASANVAYIWAVVGDWSCWYTL